MIIVYLIGFAFLTAGLFYILLDIAKTPQLKTTLVLNSLASRAKIKNNKAATLFNDLAALVAPLIPMNKYKEAELKDMLASLSIYISPKEFLSRSVLKALMIAFLSIPCYFIKPILIPVMLALAVAVLFLDVSRLRQKIIERREAIESELPRFVDMIANSLSINKDVIYLLERYKKDASEELAHELDITLADMRSGNGERALLRFESRVNSAALSDVIRGLGAIYRGEETHVYWESLSIKMSELQKQKLRGEAVKVPAKVRKLSMAIVACFTVMYLTVLIVEVMKSMSVMF